MASVSGSSIATDFQGAAASAPAMLWTVPEEFIDVTNAGLQNIDRDLGYFGNEPYVVFTFESRGGEVMWKDGHSCGFSQGGWERLSHRVEPIARAHGGTLGRDGCPATHALLIDRARGRAYLAQPMMAEVFFCAIYGYSRTRCIDPGRWARKQQQQPGN